MGGWLEFTAALGVFLASHVVPSRPGLRARLIGVLGRRGYFAVYGTISLLVVIWLISAAGRAPRIDLWWQAGWHRWVPVLVMPVAVLLAVLGLGMRYPHSLGGRKAAALDTADPGVAAVTRHPLLWALALWSLAHLVANGDLAHVILFGGFAALPLAAMPMFDRRARAVLPPHAWSEVRGRTAILSARPLADRNWWRRNWRGLLPGFVLAVALYVLIFALHQTVIGVTPVPG